MNTSLANAWHLGVKVGGKELIFSGFVHIDQPKVEVMFDDMSFEFNFNSDGAGPARYETRAEGTQKLIFDLYNHNNAIGEGVYTPIEIGHQERRKLYITYVVSTANVAGKMRRLELALYLGDEI